MQTGEEHKVMLIMHALVAYPYRVNHRAKIVYYTIWRNKIL